MNKKYFRVKFADYRTEQYFNDLPKSTFVYPRESYTGLNQYTENVYKIALMREYDCSYEEARDKFFRDIEERKYTDISLKCRQSYETAVDMMEYELRNNAEIPIKTI